MTLEQAEQKYVSETKDEKPEHVNGQSFLTREDFQADKNWYRRFSKWLTQRLERVENKYEKVQKKCRKITREFNSYVDHNPIL